MGTEQVQKERIVLEVLFFFFFLLWLGSEFLSRTFLIIQPALRTHYIFFILLLLFDIFFTVECVLRSSIAVSERCFFRYIFHGGGGLDICSSVLPLAFHSIPIFFCWMFSTTIFLNIPWTVLISVISSIRALRFVKFLRLNSKISNAKDVFFCFLCVIIFAEASNFFAIHLPNHKNEILHLHDLLSNVTSSKETEAVAIHESTGEARNLFRFRGTIEPYYMYLRNTEGGKVVFLRSPYYAQYQLYNILQKTLLLIMCLSLSLYFMLRKRTRDPA